MIVWLASLERAVPEFFRMGQSRAWETEMTAELQELFGLTTRR